MVHRPEGLVLDVRHLVAAACVGGPLLAGSAASAAGARVAQLPSAEPDLVTTRLDRSTVTGDWQALRVSVQLAVTIGNVGTSPASGPFDVTVFEDADGNGAFGAGADTVLGTLPIADLGTGASRVVQVPIAGPVRFRNNLMYALVDAGQVVAESNEGNNVRHTGQECSFRAPAGDFRPELEWQWTGSDVLAASRQVIGMPAVIDLDADGVPEVVFATFTGEEYWGHGHLRAVRGDDGSEVFTVTDPRHDVAGGGTLAVGDIDGDRRPEIVTVASVAVPTGGHNVLALLAFEHDGTFKWRSPSIQGGGDWGGAALADLDADGVPEIVIGNTVLDADGSLRWEGPANGGRADGWNGPLSLVADLDLDGRPEIVGGKTAYRADGSVLWNTRLADGFPAVADFDGDGGPEIVLAGSGQVHLLDADGRRIWGPVTLPGGADRGTGGAPTIGDMNGDGRPEIGVAGGRAYTVIDARGRIQWSKTTDDRSSGSTGSSVFDFEGDGSVEVIYGDEFRLRVYRGIDGTVLWDVPRPDCTGYDMPLVVDVDADGNAEIVSVSNNYGYPGTTGIQVYGDPADKWVATRRIWNQHSYHIDNIADDGTIPPVESPSWRTHNTYRLNGLGGDDPLAAPDVTASRIAFAWSAPERGTLSARIGNGGAIVAPRGVPVAFYAGDPSFAASLISVVALPGALEPGEWVDVGAPWSDPPIGASDVWVVADDTGAGAHTVNECDEANNVHHARITVEPPPTSTANATPTPMETVTATASRAPTGTPTAMPTAAPSGTPTATRFPTAVATPVPTPRPIYLPLLYKDPWKPEPRHTDVVVVLDASTSMAGAKLADAQAAITAFAVAMQMPGDQVALVTFSEQARLDLWLTGNRDALGEALAGIAPTSGTRVDRGLTEAVAELRGVRHAMDHVPGILLLSDGGQVEDPNAARAVAEAARADGIPIYVVGLGADANESLLVDLAGGNEHYRFAPTAEEMEDLYGEIAAH